MGYTQMNEAYEETGSGISSARPASLASSFGDEAISSLILEGAVLKAEIDGKMLRLRSINQVLAECARFKDGQKTAYLEGAGYRVKVVLKESISWDQEKVLKFREDLPEEKFARLFKTVYEPTSKKEIDGFIAHAAEDLSNGLKLCLNVKPGVPHVTYEKIIKN